MPTDALLTLAEEAERRRDFSAVASCLEVALCTPHTAGLLSLAEAPARLRLASLLLADHAGAGDGAAAAAKAHLERALLLLSALASAPSRLNLLTHSHLAVRGGGRGGRRGRDGFPSPRPPSLRRLLLLSLDLAGRRPVAAGAATVRRGGRGDGEVRGIRGDLPLQHDRGRRPPSPARQAARRGARRHESNGQQTRWGRGRGKRSSATPLRIAQCACSAPIPDDVAGSAAAILFSIRLLEEETDGSAARSLRELPRFLKKEKPSVAWV
ncbi:hypothetical protein ACP4OV_003964 [Aristida adscensionis]